MSIVWAGTVNQQRGLAYCSQVARMLLDVSVDGWNTGDHLAQAARCAGLSPEDLERDICVDQACGQPDCLYFGSNAWNNRCATDSPVRPHRGQGA